MHCRHTVKQKCTGRRCRSQHQHTVASTFLPSRETATSSKPIFILSKHSLRVCFFHSGADCTVKVVLLRRSWDKLPVSFIKQHNVTMFIIHSQSLVILLEFSLKMHQIDAFKYEIFKFFFQGAWTPQRSPILLTFFTPDPFSCLINNLDTNTLDFIQASSRTTNSSVLVSTNPGWQPYHH